MRIAIAGFLTLHGLAHLVGFLTPWGIVPGATDRAATSIFGGRVSLGVAAARWTSLLWLVGALAFILAALALAAQSEWRITAITVATLVSLILTAIWLPTARVGFYLNAAIVGTLLVTAVVVYRRDMGEARERIGAPTATVRTPFGAVQYALRGEGVPVLLVHGTGGGFDQGLFAAGDLAQQGFRLIAPSRFGYLGTPMRADASPALEADMFASLLDSLGITRVGVISFSAGTAPAVQLALRHPERVSHLVLVVPAAGGMVPVEHANAPPAFMMKVALRSDIPMWLTWKLAPAAIHRILAVPSSLVRSMDPDERAELRRGEESLFPVSVRYEGTLYDARSQSGTEPAYPLENLRVSTLLVSAADDLYRTLPNARAMATRIPGARLLAVPSGGHMLVGRGSEIWPAVATFLRQ